MHLTRRLAGRFKSFVFEFGEKPVRDLLGLLNVDPFDISDDFGSRFNEF